MSTRDDKINQLYQIFGSNTLSKNVIEQIYDSNEGDFDRTVDALLNYKAPTVPSKTLEELHREKNLETVHNMFGGDLTRSVISAVYLQNQGDLVNTVDALWNVAHDEEAIEAIRNMSSQQKEKLERDMKIEQERRLNERKLKIEKEIEEDRQKMVVLESELPSKKDESEKDFVNVLDEDQVKKIQQTKENIAQNELLISKIMKQAALCTLSICHGTKTIVVSWTLGEDLKAHPSDWIGFYKVGNPPNHYRNCIKTGGARQGHEHVNAPNTPGLYQFKYFRNSSYNEVAESDVIHIGPQIVLQAKIVEVGLKKNLIEVNYNLKGGQLSPKDWFGLFNASENNNRNYITYHEVGKNTISNSFTLPAPRVPGDYVLRFFPKPCGYNFVSKSNNVRIINKDKVITQAIKDDSSGRIQAIKVTWDIHSLDPTSRDYIALYKQDTLNSYYEKYLYVDLHTEFIIFEAPTQVGVYNFRYHSASQLKTMDVARSDPVEIPNTDTITATVENGIITVTWDIHSQPQSTWDWVGLYKKGTLSNRDYLDCKYVNTNSKLIIFNPKEPGLYEVKYFSYYLGRYTDFRSSNVVAIEN